MDSRTQERVERWDSRPFSDGFDGLSELAQNGFSGAVRAADTWLFMLNGRVVGVVDGRIEAFEDATGTTYVAPDPALPLLCSMEEDGGEARAKYYTNKTPLEEVDETLSSGSFTGYVELSERVLSGDYYLVYYGGRRMAAAYIGNAERLLTDEEAFERAADEVGIYEVYDVDVEVTDVPDASEPEPEPQSKPESSSDPDSPPTSPTETQAGATPADSSPDPNAAEDASLEGQPGEPESRPNDRERNPEPAGQRKTPRGEEQVSPSADAGGREQTAEQSPSTSPPQEPSTNPSPEVEDEGGRSDDEPDGITTTDDHPGASNPPGITDNTPDSVVEDAESDAATTGTGSRSTHSLDPDDLEAAARELGESDLPWATGETSSDPDESVPADADVSPNEVDAIDEEPSEDADETISLDIDSDTEAEDETEGEGEAETADATEESAEQLEERFKQEEQWRETRSIPSLDPDNSSEQLTSARGRSAPRQTQSQDSAPESKATSQTQADRTDDATAHSTTPSQHETADRQSHESPQTQTTETQPTETQTPTREALESDMLEREDKIDQLTQRLDNLHAHREDLEAQTEDLEAERDELRAENRELIGQVEQLQARIGELEDELERVRSVDAVGATTESAGGTRAQLSPTEALSGTNIFIRYGSKSNPTLRTAHEGEADASAVGSNLRLEHHTQFDDTNAAVDDQSYEEFLRGTIEYQFVDWLTGTLLYEIRDTDHANSLSDLYDVIPRIDRAELHASISLADDDTEDVPDLVTFDVVAFDKRGTPLVVANLNDSRDPATREMLVEIEEASSAVNANHPDLGAAMVVTSSFFDPGALEVTEQATSGGFLSRGSKQSYVNLSRKQGYHLCLVESRNGEFHMNVPEL